MAPDYDDDDIVEDYEEVATDSPARRVESAQGGPVKRPAGGARPSTTAMPAIGDPDDPSAPKRKITKKSARNIWIICILICVLGVGAVVADLVFGFTKGDPPPTIDNTGATGDGGHTLPPRERRPELTEHQKLAQTYTAEVHKHRSGAIGSRAYDFLRLAINDMNKTFDAANKDRSNDAGWVDAWIAYYNAEYAAELFYHANGLDSSDAEFTRLSDYRDIKEVEFLEEDELKDPIKQEKQGVYQAASDESTKINKHKKLLLAFVVSANVPDKEELNGPIVEAKAKLAAARENQEFVQEDLDYVNRPPRGQDEPPPYID
ncbi:MAG: hypothetical protein K8I27_05820 [Planctomycetes bacterium]|nr:hypothetical protein [Planctomycetota bacterium]